jgi:hypothetical protein
MKQVPDARKRSGPPAQLPALLSTEGYKTTRDIADSGVFVNGTVVVIGTVGTNQIVASD